MAAPDATAELAAALAAACREHDLAVSPDGRVTEPVAAFLLGLQPGSLKNRRLRLDGPRHCERPFAGFRITYRLTDLAAWLAEG